MNSDPNTWGPILTAIIIVTATTGIGFTIGLIIGFTLG